MDKWNKIGLSIVRNEGIKMARTKVGITLTEDTLKRLDEIAEQMGLTKSQAISMLVNKEYLNKYQDEDKVFKA